MFSSREKELKRVARHARLRKKIIGTTERPRICLHRSLKNLQAQMIDDSTNKVLFGISTESPLLKEKIGYGGNVKAATALGEAFAAEAKKRGIMKACFDRGGYLYHGRVKAFAEAARNGGMEF